MRRYPIVILLFGMAQDLLSKFIYALEIFINPWSKVAFLWLFTCSIMFIYLLFREMYGPLSRLFVNTWFAEPDAGQPLNFFGSCWSSSRSPSTQPGKVLIDPSIGPL
jgi:hypothetical protein